MPSARPPADEYIPRLLEGVARYEATMHNITNQYATIDGDDADVWSYAVALHFIGARRGRDRSRHGGAVPRPGPADRRRVGRRPA